MPTQYPQTSERGLSSSLTVAENLRPGPGEGGWIMVDRGTSGANAKAPSSKPRAATAAMVLTPGLRTNFTSREDTRQRLFSVYSACIK
jgi:hypothetical protein